MIVIQNDLLKIGIKTVGAELSDITSIKQNTGFMWNANPDIWSGFAPNLFPIVGALKNNSYHFEGKTYQMPKHGFVRHNKSIQLVEQTNNSATFKLSSNEETLKMYPFQFEFTITYQLIDNKLHVSHSVKNLGKKPMYFSLGGHPAFKCPIYDHENYSDYSLVFEQDETAETQLLNLNNGLVTSDTKPVLSTPNSIKLDYNLFNNDALIFKTLNSKKVSLTSKSKGDVISLHFDDFPFLGIWAKPHANFVCLEPWLGIADHENTNQDLTTKEGIIALESNKQFNARYTIEIHQPHLV